MSKAKLIFTVVFSFLLMGCNSTLVVHNAKVAEITPIFKDYIGIHGYALTYQNEQTGSYRVSLGSIYIPNTSQTTSRREATVELPATNVTYNFSQTLSSYEQSTLETVSVPGHYIEATAMARIRQQGEDVILILSSSDSLGTSLADLHDYLVESGYSVDYR